MFMCDCAGDDFSDQRRMVTKEDIRELLFYKPFARKACELAKIPFDDFFDSLYQESELERLISNSGYEIVKWLGKRGIGITLN